MKAIIFLMLIYAISVFGQKDKYWYAFEVEDTVKNPLSNSLGFKDFQGKIRIEPIYISPLTQNKKFEKIVALTEYSKDTSKGYYLNKEGKKFGIDSLYTFDFMHDTEQEGFIRFSVGRYLDSIGLFNLNGKIVIEPKYNSLSRVNNGLVVAKIGATQKHESHNLGCDHWYFEGGKEMILDTLGNVLIDDYNDNDLLLNLFSLKISDNKNQEKFRHNFIGKNGKFYSFISYREEFEDFIKNEFLKNLPKKSIETYLFVTIKKILNTKSKSELNEIASIIQNNKIEFYNFPFIFIDEEDEILLKSMEGYLDNSNVLIDDKFPILEIQSQDKSKRKEVSLSFIRTEKGYKIYDYRIYAEK